jgi:hypothetical protein
MNLVDLKARVSRLGALARGLAKEAGLWEHEEDLLLFAEKRLYTNAVMDALAGIEQATVVLAGVIRRLEGRRLRA